MNKYNDCGTGISEQYFVDILNKAKDGFVKVDISLCSFEQLVDLFVHNTFEGEFKFKILEKTYVVSNKG